MKCYDLHTHTTHSDGHACVNELVEIAKKKGYGLGISDHLFCETLNTPDKITAYLDDLSKYPVLKGCEANIGEDYSLPDSLTSRFDYIIASVHHVIDFNGQFTHFGNYFGERAQDFPKVLWDNPFQMDKSERYLTELLPVIEHTMKTQRMDIYGHCTVLPFYEKLIDTSFLTDWENEIISLCKKYKIAMEISGLWKEPGENMIRRAKDAGLKFTFGSDCHIRKDICNIDYALEMAKKVNLTEKDILQISLS